MRSFRAHARLVPLAAVVASLTAAAPAGAQVSACSSAATPPSQANVAQVERAVLCLLNRERTSRGLARLRSDGKLARAADAHSHDMVQRAYFDHTSPGGSTMLSRIRATGWFSGGRGYSVGENLAWGAGDQAGPASIVELWMHSPGHRANILNASFRKIGVGVAIGAPGEGDGATYTTDFGVKR